MNNKTSHFDRYLFIKSYCLLSLEIKQYIFLLIWVFQKNHSIAGRECVLLPKAVVFKQKSLLYLKQPLALRYSKTNIIGIINESFRFSINNSYWKYSCHLSIITYRVMITNCRKLGRVWTHNIRQNTQYKWKCFGDQQTICQNIILLYTYINRTHNKLKYILNTEGLVSCT